MHLDQAMPGRVGKGSQSPAEHLHRGIRATRQLSGRLLGLLYGGQQHADQNPDDRDND
jgi:hypothetical protein